MTSGFYCTDQIQKIWLVKTVTNMKARAVTKFPEGGTHTAGTLRKRQQNKVEDLKDLDVTGSVQD